MLHFGLVQSLPEVDIIIIIGYGHEKFLQVHLEHHAHSSLQVEPQIELLLLAFIVGEFPEHQVEDGHVCYRVEVLVLFQPHRFRAFIFSFCHCIGRCLLFHLVHLPGKE